MHPVCDESGSISWWLGAESDISETLDWLTGGTKRQNNRCMRVRDKNKDNDSGNSSIKENESVTTVQNINRFLLCKLLVHNTQYSNLQTQVFG